MYHGLFWFCRNEVSSNDNETEQKRLARLLWESNKTVQKDSKQFEKVYD